MFKAMVLKDFDFLFFRIINLNQLMDKQTNKVEVRQIKTELRKYFVIYECVVIIYGNIVEFLNYTLT